VLTVLEVVCELRLICLGSCYTGAHKLLTRGAVFLIMMSRSVIIRDRKLVSSVISMGRVAFLSCGLKTEECLFLIMGLEVDFY
jgi:hypothetical protein